MKKRSECAYFEKLGKKIIRKYFDGRPEEIYFVDNCLLGRWLSEDSHDAYEEWMKKEDLYKEIELVREVFRKEIQEMEMDSDYYDNKYDAQGVK